MSDSLRNSASSSEVSSAASSNVPNTNIGASKPGAGMMKGVVKWFNDAKGFGFIEHETGKDVFVHYSVIESEGFKTLKDGEEVAYELKEGDKGLHAARVLRPNAPPPQKKKETSGKPVQLATSELLVEKTTLESDEELVGELMQGLGEDRLSTES